MREVEVRVVRREEEARWNALLRTHHYLGFRNFCGRRLRHVAVQGDRWLALLGWHAAALHCAARDRWIGWTSLQRRQRLFLVANNSRFLLLPAVGSVPGLASRVLGLSLRRLRRDWQAVHGHDLLLAETFVDPARFAGTCYRAANWREVGRTLGYGRIRGGALGYVAHGQPKRVFLYPLRRDARTQLTARDPHPGWRAWRPRLMLTEEQMASLHRHFAQVPDPRGSRGKRYPLAAVLAIAGAARLAGCQTLTEISDFGRALGQDQLRALGCRWRPQTGRVHAPATSTLHYIFKALDPEVVERELAAWAAEQAPPDEPLAADGKYLRHSYDRDRGEGDTVRDEPAQQQLSIVGLHSRLVVDQRGFSGRKDEAEGAVLRRQLERWRDTGRCVIADALHTQRETVQCLRELNLDFVLTVKGNQPALLQHLRAAIVWPASAPPAWNLGHGRIECRRIQVAPVGEADLAPFGFPGIRTVARLTREAQCKKTGRCREPETVYLITSLAPAEATPKWLLETVRQYWGAVENGVHYVRDMALGEDACRVRKGALPRILAAFANLAISILRVLGRTNLRRAMNHFRMRPRKALAVLLGAKPLRAP